MACSWFRSGRARKQANDAAASPVVWTPHVIQVTGPEDGLVRPVGMAYWPNINQHASRAELRVLVSLADALTIFVVDKSSLTTSRRIALLFTHTGEGCYWSFLDPDVLYVPQGSGLLRYNVATEHTEVVVLSIGETKQFHSSADGRVHSFTLDGHAAVQIAGEGLRRFLSESDYDECQIDKSGRWLLIKEGAGDNRIIDLHTGREWTILNRDGAVGHSDMGYGYVVGEDDYADVGGAFRLWTFTEDGPVKGPIVHTMGTWAPMSRYVSHCNAQPGAPDGQRLLFSSTELGLVSVTIGSGSPVFISPSLMDVNAPGGGDAYWRETRANSDPSGKFACFSGNQGTDRMDVFLVRLP